MKRQKHLSPFLLETQSNEPDFISSRPLNGHVGRGVEHGAAVVVNLSESVRHLRVPVFRRSHARQEDALARADVHLLRNPGAISA